TLNAGYFLRDEFGGEQGVFAEGLEIAACLRHTHDVHHWRQQDILVAFAAFEADHVTVVVGHVAIEGGGKRHRGRQGSGGQQRADTGGTVGHAHGRNTEP